MTTIARNFSAAVAAGLLAMMLTVPAPRLQAQSGTPAASRATPTPAQVVDQLLTMVEKELVPLAEAMPADKYDFAPTNGNFKGVRTFAGQVKHVAEANYSIFGTAASMQSEAMPKAKAIKELKTKAEIVQALKDSFVFAHRAVATLTAQNALEPVKAFGGINTRAGLMAFGVIHMNDHFGQMVVYLRMNGIVPPSSRPKKK